MQKGPVSVGAAASSETYSIPAFRNHGSVTGGISTRSFDTRLSLRTAVNVRSPAVTVTDVSPVGVDSVASAALAVVGAATGSSAVSEPQAAAARATATAVTAKVRPFTTEVDRGPIRTGVNRESSAKGGLAGPPTGQASWSACARSTVSLVAAQLASRSSASAEREAGSAV